MEHLAQTLQTASAPISAVSCTVRIFGTECPYRSDDFSPG